MRREEAEREAAWRNAHDERRTRLEFYAFDASVGLAEEAWDVTMRLRAARAAAPAPEPVAAPLLQAPAEPSPQPAVAPEAMPDMSGPEPSPAPPAQPAGRAQQAPATADAAPRLRR